LCSRSPGRDLVVGDGDPADRFFVTAVERFRVAYAELQAKLSERPSPTIVTFPDGSVDSYSRSRSESGGLSSIRELSRELARGKRSFHLEPESREKGGQAVNIATQVHALGGRAELYGHLDDALFEDLPFPTVSMGDPAAVSVLELGDDGLLFVTVARSSSTPAI
jgi:hypothetical protein